jgi:hypothetical protein
MIRHALIAAVAVLSGSALVASAAPKDEVTDAAKKLAEAPNYSWHAETEMQGAGGGNRFGGPTDGKAEKGGFIHLTMTRGDNTTEAIKKGDKGAVKTQDGWKSLEELQQQADQGGQGQGNRGRFMGRMLRTFQAPAQEAQDLAAKAKEITKSGDAYTGELTPEGAADLLLFRGGRGGNAPAPANAKGTIKYWLKDGQLAKYEYNVKGTMSFNGNDIDIDRTTTIEVKDVGSTKVQVPEDAKGKVS